MNELAKHGLIEEDCMTVTGKTVGENIKGARILRPEVIHTYEEPVRRTGGICRAEGQPGQRLLCGQGKRRGSGNAETLRSCPGIRLRG